MSTCAQDTKRQGHRVVSVNQDRGIAPEKRKGAAMHLSAMREAFGALGRAIVAIDESDETLVRRRLQRAYSEAPIELIYERYALGRSSGAEFAMEKQLPFTIEVNAPLADENRHWRGVAETERDRSRDRFVFENADCIIAVSSQVATYALERGARAERVHVFPNGVSTSSFRPRTERDLLRPALVPDQRLAVGFHGRLRPWHGFERLVAVCAQLLERDAPIHLVVIGEGDFERYLDGTIPRDRRTLVGWKPPHEIGRYVAAFDVLPLTYDPELPCYFSPLKLMEAMACAVVPVVPMLGDLDRVVRHDVDGIVYRASEPSEMVSAILSLIRHPERRRRLASNALARAREHSWERIAQFVLKASAGSSS